MVFTSGDNFGLGLQLPIPTRINIGASIPLPGEVTKIEVVAIIHLPLPAFMGRYTEKIGQFLSHHLEGVVSCIFTDSTAGLLEERLGLRLNLLESLHWFWHADF